MKPRSPQPGRGRLSKKCAPWDPSRDPDLFAHLGSIVNTLVWNHVTSGAAKAARGKMTEAERVADSTDSAEDQLASKDYATRSANASVPTRTRSAPPSSFT